MANGRVSPGVTFEHKADELKIIRDFYNLPMNQAHLHEREHCIGTNS